MANELSIQNGRLLVRLTGADWLFAFRRGVDVPLAHVRGALVDPTIARPPIRGIRWPGTSLPGTYTAGTIMSDGMRMFWNVRDPNNVVVVDLRDEEFTALVLDFVRPSDVARAVNAAIVRV